MATAAVSCCWLVVALAGSMAAAHVALLLCKKKNKSERAAQQSNQTENKQEQRNEYDLCATESVRVCCVKKSQFFIQSYFFYCFISLSLINLSFHSNSNNNCNKIIANQPKRYLIYHTKKHTHTLRFPSASVCVCECVIVVFVWRQYNHHQPSSVRSVFIYA